MTKLSISDGQLIVEMQGWDKLWALKSRLEVPLRHVSGARAADGERARGLRLPGTYIPGVITAGTFRSRGENVFWAVHRPQEAIAIDLHDEFYSRLVIQVDDPAAAIAAIQAALTAAGA